MVETKRKKVLLALDGSERSFEVVKYVGRVALFREADIRLFGVYEGLPGYYYDIDSRDPAFAAAFRDCHAWEVEQKRRLNEGMFQAKTHLMESGFPEERITATIQKRATGIARDIMKEAANGYSAVLIGRKGESRLKGVLFGSVAAKLIDRISDVPLCVVGREIPVTGKILLALDASENAMRAVQFIGRHLAGRGIDIELFHVIRGNLEDLPVELRDAMIPDERREQIEREMVKVFDHARRKLVEAGVSDSQIRTQIVAGRRSRANNIIREAEEGNFGTIVMGRRGASRISDFFMGRVTNKVLQMARFHAVWLVN
jgi:nucleotide-binding universal stress UspA family protein